MNNEDGALQSVADEIAGMGRRSLAVKTDISQKSQVDELVTQAMDVLGGVDILMNVAVRYHRKSVLDLDDQDWDDLTNVNLKGIGIPIKPLRPSCRPKVVAALSTLPLVAA